MESENFNWGGYEWMTHPKWGIVHPNDKINWYDPKAVDVDKNNNVILDVNYNPREFETDGVKATRPYGRGYARTLDEFKYGTFEWECRVPYGRNLWPALWLSSDYSWPPEIDCMEGWSENSPLYIKNLLFRSIHPTVHWSEDCDPKKEHRATFTKPVWRWLLKCGKNFDKYKVVWTPKYVDVYYNDKLVKRFNDPEYLKHMNLPDMKMHVIMCNKGDTKFGEYDYKDYKKNKCPMAVKSFKYTPYTE